MAGNICACSCFAKGTNSSATTLSQAWAATMSLLTDNREGADEHLIFIFSNLLNNMYDQFVVNFKDTHIMMLLVCFEKKNSHQRIIWSGWLSTVTTSPFLYQVDSFAKKLGNLLASHVRTGGDTISCTYKIGKLTALHLHGLEDKWSGQFYLVIWKHL